MSARAPTCARGTLRSVAPWDSLKGKSCASAAALKTLRGRSKKASYLLSRAPTAPRPVEGEAPCQGATISGITPGVADITWSAYALAMFTPEERAAAAAVTYEPPDNSTPIPPGGPRLPVESSGSSPIPGLNPNNPADLQRIMAAGWRYDGGRWLNGSLGVLANPDGVSAGRPSGAFFQTAAVIPGGSVLGYTVPTAPAVLLPSFVGGRLGALRMGEGLRPESGGTDRVRFGTRASLPQVRGLEVQ